jgi:hypothetical protein
VLYQMRLAEQAVGQQQRLGVFPPEDLMRHRLEGVPALQKRLGFGLDVFEIGQAVPAW